MAGNSVDIWEKKLNIVTSAANHEKNDSHHSRYEPTDYAVLERLAQSGEIEKEDILIDYGCGKGRAGFFLHFSVGCSAVGIEYNPELYNAAEANRKRYAARHGEGVSFLCASAEDYELQGETCFYFFNPFSETILRSVLGRIYASYYEEPRRMKLFFYFPMDNYLSLLMTEDMLCHLRDIDCRDIFSTQDPREKIAVFTIG